MLEQTEKNGFSQEWYVLSVAFGRELQLKERLLEKGGIHCFVPERRVRRRNAAGRFFYRRMIAVPNYVFALSSLGRLLGLKRENPWLFEDLNFVRRENSEGRTVPVTVPRDQMTNFIAVAGNEEEHVLFLDPQQLDLSKGERVRILGGPFEGVEGVFLRVSKKHEKRVVVQIEGVSAVATTALPSCLVQKLDD